MSTPAAGPCTVAYRLKDPLPDDAEGPDRYQCPPCNRGERTPWVVTAGYQQALVHAGCADAATMAVWHQLAFGRRPRGTRQWQGTNGRDGFTARPATPTDVARFAEMIAQQAATP